MALDQKFQDNFKQIILTGSHSFNINCIKYKTSIKSIGIIKKYVHQEPELVMEYLTTLKEHIIDIDIPLLIIAELNNMNIVLKDLERIFNTYIKDILGLLRLAEILSYETGRRQIRGSLRKLIIGRLEKLNEKDIIQYFGAL